MSAATGPTRKGANIIILSDRGVDENHVAIPSLLAVSAMEQHLIRTKKRTAVSIILESGEPRDVHHFAALLGYGARAVNPYLAQETIVRAHRRGACWTRTTTPPSHDYNEAVLHGIVKIASKMGISTLQSYQSAQIFEAVGISREVIDKYFTNTVSRVGGIGLKEIDDDGGSPATTRPSTPWAWSVDTDPGQPRLATRPRSGGDKEDHLYNPQTIHLPSSRPPRPADYEMFKEYTAHGGRRDPSPHPAGPAGLPVPERTAASPWTRWSPRTRIVKRFKTGAMSYGSISQEAHECLAIAMNRLGGKSNSGEGGEKPDAALGTDEDCCAIKQVASGRFGVTSEYLVSAKEIQIKMAQGAKPGEGGHLPGEKGLPLDRQDPLLHPRCHP